MATPRILMCPPEFFAVEYVINPWMEGQIGNARNDTAVAQWHALREFVSSLTEVELIQPGEHLPDMCFAANGGLVVGKRFVKPRFRVAQRQPEEDLFAEWFRQRNYEIISLPDDEPFEGEGDALIHPGFPLLWAGYGCRSCLDAHRTLTEALDVEVVSLRLVDQRFYHLDTCFYPLPGNRVVYYPAAFDDLSLREIERRVPEANRIQVQEADAMNFTCNALCIGETIITNAASEKLQSDLKQWGYTVKTIPVSEFMLAGGAVKCLSLLIDQDLGDGAESRPQQSSTLVTTRLSVNGHLLDTGLLNRMIDTITDAGGSCFVEDFAAAERKDQTSTAILRVTSPTSDRLDEVVGELIKLGAEPATDPVDATLAEVEISGVAPENFYATNIYPTDVRVEGDWIRVDKQRMDGVIVVDKQDASATCRLMRNLQQGESVVTGYQGVRVHAPNERQSNSEFAFMSAAVSTERRVELEVESLAWEMQRIRSRKGKIAVVAGPVVIHTGGGKHLSRPYRGWLCADVVDGECAAGA